MNWYTSAKVGTFFLKKIAAPHVTVTCPSCNKSNVMDANEPVDAKSQMRLHPSQLEDPLNIRYRRLGVCQYCGEKFIAQIKGVGLFAEPLNVKRLKPQHSDMVIPDITHVKTSPHSSQEEYGLSA